MGPEAVHGLQRAPFTAEVPPSPSVGRWAPRATSGRRSGCPPAPRGLGIRSRTSGDVLVRQTHSGVIILTVSGGYQSQKWGLFPLYPPLGG